jgi:hypothetical protein
MNIKDLSKEALSFFKAKRLKDKVVYSIDIKSPEWVREMVMDAVSGSHPDDFVYSKVFYILDEICNGNKVEEDNLVPDSYINEMLDWLFGNNTRLAVCDSLLSSRNYSSLEKLLTDAQLEEINEIKDNVLSCLETELEGRGVDG